MPEKENTLGLTVKPSEDFSEWYNQIVVKAKLADYSAVKGCMIILPNGYALWEKIQQTFDKAIKQHNVQNAYFPLFIPESFFQKEAKHAKGFAPEVAWVMNKGEGERLAVRPTSETIIVDSFAKWVRSYRDLPLKVNQWCNVVRWETNTTRLFLRTREFLWQEGHCIYQTPEEADKETLIYLHEYKKLSEELLAIPVMIGKKTEAEKFAGAVYTTTMEAMMPDGKALQMGTSHNLGQGFMEAFGVSFLDEQSKKQVPWYISWGVSTRLLGALVMAHSDEKGLVLPPSIAPTQIVIVPIFNDTNQKEVLKKAQELKKRLEVHTVYLDDRDNYMPGWKFNEWELKGIPLRIEIGPKDIAKEQVVIVRRDSGKKEMIPMKELEKKVKETLESMQKEMFAKAEKHLKESIVEVKTWKDAEKAFKEQKGIKMLFCGRAECEKQIKEKTTASSRCFPFNQKPKKGKCVHCNESASEECIFAKSY